MGIRITSDEQVVCLYDSVENRAFGPVFETGEQAEAFLKFVEQQTTTSVSQIPWPTLRIYYGEFMLDQS